MGSSGSIRMRVVQVAGCRERCTGMGIQEGAVVGAAVQSSHQWIFHVLLYGHRAAGWIWKGSHSVLLC